MNRDTENLPANTANEINKAHRLAYSSAETAVQYAIECGKLLCQLKDDLPHGSFQGFVTQRLDFAPSTARKYMQAARQNATGVAFSSLREMFPSGKEKPKPRDFPSEKPETDQVAAAKAKPPAPEPDLEILSDGWEPDEDLDAELAQAEKAYAESIDKVMAADDKLAAAHDEIKRQAAEIASLRQSRDGYMNAKAEVTRLLKKEKQITKSLLRQQDKLKAEIEGLQERIAIMETS